MKTTHTPGPWKKHPDSFHVLNTDQNCIITTIDATTLIPREEKRANARLIAAAPELLEALKEALDWFDRLSRKELHPSNHKSQIDQIQKAIQKATAN